MTSSPRHSIILPIFAALFMAGCATTPRTSESQIPAALSGLSVEDMVTTGDEAARQGNFERAMFIYMQALSLEPTADLWFRLGRVNSSVGRQQEAWKAYATTLNLEPDHAGANEELGLLNLASGEKAAATQYLRRAIELDPTRWRAHNALGIMADVEENYGAAISHYENALEYATGSPMILNNLGYSHYLAGNWKLAEQHFRMAIALESDYRPALANLGLLYARQQRYELAAETLNTVMDKHRAYNDVGYIAYHNRDYESSIELLAEAIRLSPTYYELAYENLEAARKARNERARALSELAVPTQEGLASAKGDDSVPADSRPIPPSDVLMSVPVESESEAASDSHATEIFKLDDPVATAADDDASTARHHYSLAVLAETRDEYVQALGHYQAALAYDPDSALILSDISMLHLKMGNVGDAEVFYERALSEAGDKPGMIPPIEKLDHIRERLAASAR